MQSPEQSIGAVIEHHTRPDRCKVEVAGDSSTCWTCGARWDTNTLGGNVPPNCALEVDPFRGGLLT